MKLEPLRIKCTVGEFKLKVLDLFDQTWSTGETIEIEERHFSREKLGGEYIAIAYVATDRTGIVGDLRWKYATIHAIETIPHQEIMVTFRDGFIDPVFRGYEHDPSKIKPIGQAFEEAYESVRGWSNQTSMLRQLKQEPDTDAGVQEYTTGQEDTRGAKKKIRQKRGPSVGTLTSCRQAMQNWLTDGQKLTAAAELAGVDKKTVRRHIPAVLDMVDITTRNRWIAVLRGLGMSDYLGKYKEDEGTGV